MCVVSFEKEFLIVDGLAFLSAAFCYGLMLNIDWFQPYEPHTYSLGVIYLVVMMVLEAKYHY